MYGCTSTVQVLVVQYSMMRGDLLLRRRGDFDFLPLTISPNRRKQSMRACVMSVAIYFTRAKTTRYTILLVEEVFRHPLPFHPKPVSDPEERLYGGP
jgi:hypothetical protein